MDKTPLLSICIPIYNRRAYLERMLARFYEDRTLFEHDVQLYVSDNCSTEDIKSLAEYYLKIGLNLTYHCNESNLGMDGNFINCFNHARGKYIWLLGSDDIPKKGFLKDVLRIISDKDFGLLHLSSKNKERYGELIEYNNANSFFEDIHIYITYISGNIVRSTRLSDEGLNRYKGTFISQVPYYLHSMLSSKRNAIYFQSYIDDGNDAKNNGGYNLLKVFVDNFYSICQEFVSKGMMTQCSFEIVKRRAFRDWLVEYIIVFLVFGNLKKTKHFDTSNSLSILKKHYCHKVYAYYYFLKSFVRYCVTKTYRYIRSSFEK